VWLWRKQTASGGRIAPSSETGHQTVTGDDDDQLEALEVAHSIRWRHSFPLRANFEF
jgi:hypothetical protein